MCADGLLTPVVDLPVLNIAEYLRLGNLVPVVDFLKVVVYILPCAFECLFLRAAAFRNQDGTELARVLSRFAFSFLSSLSNAFLNSVVVLQDW